MEWIVKIEGEEEKKQRIRILFNPLEEKIYFYGEYKPHNKSWEVFSLEIHDKIEIDLDELTILMEKSVVEMQKRIKKYENLNDGFKVLKWISFEED